jgi:hypothetical protein
MEFDKQCTQASTKRALVWCIVGIVGIAGWWMGKDISGIVALGAGVAGGMGLVKD